MCSSPLMEVGDKMSCMQDISWIDKAKPPQISMEFDLKLVFGHKPSTSLLVDIIPTDL
jgi:hypothetical protein